MESKIPANYRPPTTVDELVARYLEGERYFRRTSLSDVVIEQSLPGIDLSESTLRVIFNDVSLSGACFRDADLAFTHFAANLTNAVFEGADLAWVDFGSSNLTNALLGGCELRHTNFESSVLDDADFTQASFEGTKLLDVSLVSLCSAADVVHNGPSYVDHRSVIRSLPAPRLKECLLRMGMPAVFVEYTIACAESLTEPMMSLLLQSTFISYGQPDVAFARRLNEALHVNGVRTFFFAEHAPPGKKLHRMMRDNVNNYDRVVLICSKASLSRPGVLNEVEETLQREARDGGASYLIPIRLDDYIFDPDCSLDLNVLQAIRDRVVADFTNIDADDSRFNLSLQKLIAALRKHVAV